MKQKDFLNNLQQKKYIFIGEIHGTKEIPAKIGKIIKELSKNKSVLFCEEFPYQAESEIKSFLESKINKEKLFSSLYLKDAIHDNRITPNILKLWKILFKNNINIKGIEDNSLEDISERDHSMAKRFLEIIKTNNAEIYIIYCGNIHLLNEITTIQSFAIKPIKIFLPEEIIKESLTIQFYPAQNKESIELKSATNTINYYLKLKEIKAITFSAQFPTLN